MRLLNVPLECIGSEGIDPNAQLPNSSLGALFLVRADCRVGENLFLFVISETRRRRENSWNVGLDATSVSICNEPFINAASVETLCRSTTQNGCKYLYIYLCVIRYVILCLFVYVLFSVCILIVCLVVAILCVIAFSPSVFLTILG